MPPDLALPGGLGQARVMRQQTTELTVQTPGQGMHDCTDAVRRWVDEARAARTLVPTFDAR